MVILFSFAFLAIVLTMINVGMNQSGNKAFTTVTSAYADGDIGLSGGFSGGFNPPSVLGCVGGCKNAPVPAGQGGGSVGAISDDTIKSTYYTCNSTDSAGNCRINNVVEADALVRSEYCIYYLRQNGAVVGLNGHGGVQYLKARLIGQWFNPYNAAERMYNHLTGSGLGWLPLPTTWTDLRYGYNGTTADRWEGNLFFGCQKFTKVDYAHYILKSTVCYPKYDGRPFPYAVGYYVTYKNLDNQTIQGRDNYDWVIKSASCIYISASTPPPKIATGIQKCYWNIQHYGNYSTNKAAILNGGTTTTNRPVSPYQGAVQPSIVGSNSTARVVNCTTNVRMDANLSLRDGYAYYRLTGTANYQLYQHYIWDPAYARGQRLPANVVPVGTGIDSLRVYGTHSCSTNPPYREYPSWGSLPNISFNYSDCGRNRDWTCVIPHAPRINGVANNVEVMRDGSYLPTNLGGVNVSGSAIRDMNTKHVGTVADSNMSYLVKVVNSSSPFNGSNANAPKQYFELWKGDKATETLWGNWISQPNANRNGYLTFYWSSDNGQKWQMTYQAKLNIAEFSIPWQNGSREGVTSKWMSETNVDCDGIKTSNAATVLRSVSSEG